MRHFKKIDWSISLSLLFACALTVIAACVESSGPLGAPNNVVYVGTVSSVQMTLAQSTLAPGQTTQATAVATSADGKVVDGRVDFSSKNASVATVSSNGVVAALAAGVTVIQATVASRAASATVTVKSLVSPVAVVAVALDSTSLAIGHSAKASATAKDSAGNLITGQTVTWASLSPPVATVSSTGTVTAVAAGSATIQGTVSGKTGSASLKVIQVPASTVSVVAVQVDSTTLLVSHVAHASATAKDAMGNPITGQVFTWASLTPGIATVSSSGAVTAVTPGPAIIQASVSGVTGLDTLVVVVPPNLAFHDFNDGTIGPFYTNPYTQAPADLDFPADPTGSGRGNVMREHYWRTSSTDGSADRNRAIQFSYAQRYGMSLYFKGDFYIPAASLGDGFHQRKLAYWQPHVDYNKYGGSGGPGFVVILDAFGVDLVIHAEYVDQAGVLQVTNTQIATIAANQWYVAEIQLTMESSIGAGDGILRVWLDGTLRVETTTLHLSDPAWIGQPVVGGNGTPLDLADVYFERFQVGQQFDWTGAYDEYRYWDNVGFSTERIGK